MVNGNGKKTPLILQKSLTYVRFFFIIIIIFNMLYGGCKHLFLKKTLA